MYPKLLKNVFDIMVAVLLLVILSPIIFIITIILAISNDGKPFFIQTRPGKNENIFKIIKFKTMNDKRDSLGTLLPDYQRMTKIGKFIRSTSLDEIPQLFNVLKGDMSIIGPRPLLVSYLQHYNEEQAKRHKVKPGITGWAQVNGRNAISWDQKFKYDTWYVNNISFKLDMKILWLTIKKVIKSEGISASENETMELFTGTDN